MHKRLLAILLSAGLITGLDFVGGASAATNADSSVSLSPIIAKFSQAEFATHYDAYATDKAGRTLKYSWALKLQLVDRPAAPDPAEPGSKAAVDSGCNNHGNLSSTAVEFIWQHGDASLGACDHSKMGPSGHQGKIDVVVSDGVWACTATYNGSNTGTGKGVVCAQLVTVTRASTPVAKCQGPTIKILDNSNGGGVLGGGRPPSFMTKGVRYCLMQIVTYHWNNGEGAKPGTLGLNGLFGAKLGPWPATGSSGQGNAADVNWTANLSTLAKPVVIRGVYSCVDSDPATWSQNTQSHGTGFCQVYVEKAEFSTTTSSATVRTPTMPTPTKTVASAAAKCKGAKLSLKATPDTGKPPLNVKFAICSLKSLQWRIDFGDGKSKVTNGTPPTSISHTYVKEGDYRPRLITTASTTAATGSTATTSVSVHKAQLISLTANPASGRAPLRVSFGLGTTVTNITTWTLDFGDGQRTGGSGKPTATVVHSYAKDGNYKATFSVKPGAYAVVFTMAQITVGAGTPPILRVSASPASGVHPLAVRFAIGTTIPGVIVSWVMKFGDGSQQSGQGKPPSSVSHTYTKKGTFLAYLLVSQQQQYGGVQYVVPRNGLAIQVG